MPSIPELVEPPAVGAIDGVNKDFETANTYLSGSVRVYINGQLHRAVDDDGWTEEGGKKFKLKEAPRTGDVIQVRYRPV
jgi:hypothetical protein